MKKKINFSFKIQIIFILYAIIFISFPKHLTAETNFLDSFETDVNNDQFPDRWIQVYDDTHPRYNRIIQKQSDESISGKNIIKFVFYGSNTSIQTSDFFTVEPNRIYRLSGWAKVNGLKKNRAFLAIHWFDEIGTPLSVIDVTNSISRNSEWVLLKLTLNQIPLNAKFLKISCNINGGDIKGECYFDDITLEEWQTISIIPANKKNTGNTYEENESIAFKINAGKFYPGKYYLKYNVNDVFINKVIPEKVVEISLDTYKSIEHLLILPSASLKPGYYDLNLTLSKEDKTQIANTSIGFGIITPYLVKGNFFITYDPFLPNSINTTTLQALSSNKIKIPIWSPNNIQLKKNSNNPVNLIKIFEDINNLEMKIIGELSSTPSSLKASLGEQSDSIASVGDLFILPPQLWENDLRNTIKQYSEFIDEWQIGSDYDDTLFDAMGPKFFLNNILETTRKERSFTNIGIPVNSSYSKTLKSPNIDLSLLSFINLININDENLAELNEIPANIKDKSIISYTLHQYSDTPIKERYIKQLQEISYFTIKALSNNFNSIEFSPQNIFFSENGYPTPSFYALRNLNILLSGSTPLSGDIIQFKDINSRAFDKDGISILALWTNSGKITKKLSLGPGKMTIFYPDGSSKPIPPGVFKDIEVSELPIFIYGIQTDFLKTMASTAVKKNIIESRLDAQLLIFSIKNYFKYPLKNCKIDIKLPKEWLKNPYVIEVPYIAPGETYNINQELFLPYIEKRYGLDFVIEITASINGKEQIIQSYKRLVINSPIDVKNKVEAYSESVVKLSLKLENITQNELNARCFLSLPGIVPFEATILNLIPGETKKLYFYIPKDSFNNNKDNITFTFRSTDGTYFLNRVLDFTTK